MSVETAPPDVSSPSDAMRARAGRVLNAATSVPEPPPTSRKRPENLSPLGDVALQMCHIIWRSELSSARLDMAFNTLSQYQQMRLLEQPQLIEKWTTYYGLNGDDGYEFNRFMTGDLIAFKRIRHNANNTPEYSRM